MVAALPVNLPAGCADPERIEIFSCFWLQPVLDQPFVDGLQLPVATDAAAEGQDLPVQVKSGQDLFHLQSWPDRTDEVTMGNNLAL
jgi:hypothetical protein